MVAPPAGSFISLYLGSPSEKWRCQQYLPDGDVRVCFVQCCILSAYKSSRHTYCKNGETEWGKPIAPRFCYLPLTLEKALAPTLSCPTGERPWTPSPEGRLLLTKLDSSQSFCGAGATSDSVLFHKHASQGAEKLLRTSMKPSAKGNATVTHMDWIFCSFSYF